MIYTNVRMPCGGIFDLENKTARLQEVNNALEDPHIWDDPEKAQSLGRERSRLETIVQTMGILQTGLADFKDLITIANEENDTDGLQELISELDKLSQQVDTLEFTRMFSHEMDPANAFLDIQAAGLAVK